MREKQFLRKAAKIIVEEGHDKHDMATPRGYCMVGAYCKAKSIDDPKWSDSENFWPLWSEKVGSVPNSENSVHAWNRRFNAKTASLFLLLAAEALDDL